MEDHSRAVDEVPGPESTVPTPSAVEVAVNSLSVIQVWGGVEKPKPNKTPPPLKPHHFGYVYGTGSQAVAVVQLRDG